MNCRVLRAKSEFDKIGCNMNRRILVTRYCNRCTCSVWIALFAVALCFNMLSMCSSLCTYTLIQCVLATDEISALLKLSNVFSTHDTPSSLYCRTLFQHASKTNALVCLCSWYSVWLTLVSAVLLSLHLHTDPMCFSHRWDLCSAKTVQCVLYTWHTFLFILSHSVSTCFQNKCPSVFMLLIFSVVNTCICCAPLSAPTHWSNVF